MQTARRRRTIVATAVSAVAHVVVLTVLALQTPMLRIPPQERGPPEAIIPILIMPRTPPPAGANARPAPIRLHRRPQRNLPHGTAVAPLPAPAPGRRGGRASPAAAAPLHPAPLPEGPKGDVRTALRRSPVGCGNDLAVGLNRAERELCDESLGKGAKDADFIPPGAGMTAAKRALLDQAAAAKERRHTRAQEAPIGPPALQSSRRRALPTTTAIPTSPAPAPRPWARRPIRPAHRGRQEAGASCRPSGGVRTVDALLLDEQHAEIRDAGDRSGALVGVSVHRRAGQGGIAAVAAADDADAARVDIAGSRHGRDPVEQVDPASCLPIRRGRPQGTPCRSRPSRGTAAAAPRSRARPGTAPGSRTRNCRAQPARHAAERSAAACDPSAGAPGGRVR